MNCWGLQLLCASSVFASCSRLTFLPQPLLLYAYRDSLTRGPRHCPARSTQCSSPTPL